MFKQLAAVLLASLSATAQTVIFATDFENGVPPQFGGTTTVEGTQGFAAFGQPAFASMFLRNGTGCPAAPTTLTLTGLPPHNVIDIEFLLAVIDTWDGLEPCCGPDYLRVSVDGQVVFQASFKNAFGGGHPYTAPPGGLLVENTQLGFRATNTNDQDSAFDMSVEPSLRNIPHTSASASIEWIATGAGWQHTCAGANLDESWAIDNVRILVANAIPSSQTVRLGTPPNPNALLVGQTSGPVLGHAWDPVIDHASFAPSSLLDALFVGSVATNIPVGGLGTVLIDPGTSAAVLGPPGSVFLVAIPTTPALAGSAYHAQGLSIDAAGALLLTNALDIVIGTY